MLVAFDDVSLLGDAAGRCLTGSFPRLRFLSLFPRQVCQPVVDALPAHIARRVVIDPPPAMMQSGFHLLLTSDVVSARVRFPQIVPSQIVSWAELPQAYAAWEDAVLLPRREAFARTTSEDLDPLGWEPAPIMVEIVGSCQAETLDLVARQASAAGKLVGQITTCLTVQNLPVPIPPHEQPDAVVVFPGIRLMHPERLDRFVSVRDHDTFFAETVEYLRCYLDSVIAVRRGVPTWVLGVMEPVRDALGAGGRGLHLSDQRYFMRRLNDEILRWCEEQDQVHFADVDAHAGAWGKAQIDEAPIVFSAHRTPSDPTGDPYGRQALELFYVDIMRTVRQQLVTISGEAQVKAVIVDLDNTMWDGLASDLDTCAWTERSTALADALRTLKRRGILLAVASKNDESFIRAHWPRLVGGPSSSGRLPLDLDDFDAVKISFRPKSETIAEVLRDFNILEDSVVFIDDNPLEREEVQARFPDMRMLGSAMDHVRSALLSSPFTQRHVRLAEDRLRAASLRQQAVLRRELEEGGATAFLSTLGLECTIRTVDSVVSPSGQRAVQLVNKTNQWSLNGARLADHDLAVMLAEGRSLIVAEVNDRANEYGIVAALLVEVAQRRVTHMVVSCRVIGMGIDRAIAAWLYERYGALRYEFCETGRNKAAQAFLEEVAGQLADEQHAGAQMAGPWMVEAVSLPVHVTVKDASPTAAPDLPAPQLVG